MTLVWTPGYAGDEHYDSVSLLLYGNGTNGSTTITDNSPSPKTVTASGNAQISTAQSKFGGASIAFDGTGDYLSIADDNSFDLGTGDFTIETWAYIQSTGDYSLYSHAASGGPMLIVFGGSFVFRRFAVANVVTASALPPTNQWVHIAACRNGTSTRLFFNGVQTGSTATDTANYTVAAPVYIAVDLPDAGPVYLNGYIDDFRITKGVARYTANFTPPTESFPGFTYTPGKLVLKKDSVATDPNFDPNFANVSLLLHGDGTNGSTTITDSSPSPKTVTAVGNAQISTAQSKFGGASIAFDGTGDYLSVPQSTSFDLPSDFTVECWVYLSNVSGTTAIVGKWGGPGAYAWILQYISGTGLRLFTGVGGSLGTSISGAFTAVINTWHHLAVTRSSNSIKMFADGTQVGSTTTNTDNLTATNQALNVGRNADTDIQYLTGYIDDLRITKGVARYTAAFTPPTTPFPDR